MRAQRAGRYGWPNGLNNQRRAGPVIAMTKKRRTRGKKHGPKEQSGKDLTQIHLACDGAAQLRLVASVYRFGMPVAARSLLTS